MGKRLAIVFCILFFCSFSISPLRAEKKYHLALCAIFQEEGPYLKEWLEYYRLLGVEHFYLFNNESTDNYQNVLKPYIEKGIVDLWDWPTLPTLSRSVTQLLAYNHALPLITKECDWVGFLDLDEFAVPMQHDNLTDFLKDYEEVAGIVMNWQIYGTSGKKRLEKKALQIEHLVYKHPKNYYRNKTVKSFFKPDLVQKLETAHWIKYKAGHTAVDEDKEPIPEEWFHGRKHTIPYVKVNRIRLNHYWYRSEEFFRNVKLKRLEKLGRGNWSEDVIKEQFEHSNSVYDPCAHKFLKKLKAKITRGN